jgi:hypothetical protein
MIDTWTKGRGWIEVRTMRGEDGEGEERRWTGARIMTGEDG